MDDVTADVGALPAPKMPLWMDQRRIVLQAHFDNGPLYLETPRVLTPNEIGDLEAYLALFVASFRRRAQAIESKEPPHG